MFEQLDIPMARKVLEFLQIEHEGFKHDQGPYYVKNDSSQFDDGYCGTAACVAGTAVMLSPEYEIRATKNKGEFAPFKGGQEQNWHTSGRDLLGLTDDQSDRLFYCTQEGVALERLGQWIQTAERERVDG